MESTIGVPYSNFNRLCFIHFILTHSVDRLISNANCALLPCLATCILRKNFEFNPHCRVGFFGTRECSEITLHKSKADSLTRRPSLSSNSCKCTGTKMYWFTLFFGLYQQNQGIYHDALVTKDRYCHRINPLRNVLHHCHQ